MKTKSANLVSITKLRGMVKTQGANIIHTYPLNEGHLVSEFDEVCWCEPLIEDYTATNAGALIIHNKVSWQ